VRKTARAPLWLNHNKIRDGDGHTDGPHGEALVDVLRADNGKALRNLLKACSTRDDPASKRLAETLATLAEDPRRNI
jgi:hypothetical protein